MVTRTHEVEKTVTEEETIKECDYCRLMTSEDVDGDFAEMLLAPGAENTLNQINYTENYVKRELRKYGETVNEEGQIHIDDVDKIIELITRSINYESEHRADLCPNCAEQLFGDGPDTMIREGTGLIGSAE
jgi:hypothetical protein